MHTLLAQRIWDIWGTQPQLCIEKLYWLPLQISQRWCEGLVTRGWYLWRILELLTFLLLLKFWHGLWKGKHILYFFKYYSNFVYYALLIFLVCALTSTKFVNCVTFDVIISCNIIDDNCSLRTVAVIYITWHYASLVYAVFLFVCLSVYSCIQVLLGWNFGGMHGKCRR